MASSPHHSLALPPNFSPDTIDVLTELSVVLSKVRAGLQSSTGIAATPQPPQGSDQLSFKDVPGATDGIKHKLQRAREQVAALPDMSRGLAEQEVEMAELRARIESQRALLGRLRDSGLAFARGEGDAGAAATAAATATTTTTMTEGGGDRMET